METKFVTFLVFAIIVQGSNASRLKVTYGLSDDQVPILEEIIDNQEASRTESSEGYGSIFDVISDLGTETDFSEVAEAIVREKYAFDSFFDSVILLLGESSSADVELVREETCDYLDDAAGQITSALELALSGNYFENQAAIEDYQAAALQDFTDLTVNTYDLIRTGVNTDDADVQDVIENAQSASLVGLEHSVNAIFNAIKLAAVAVDEEYERKASKFYIEELRAKALFGSKNDVESKFGALRTLYINRGLNLSGIASVSAAIQRAQIVSQARYDEGNVVLFDTLKRYLIRILYSFSADGTVDFSQDNIDLQNVISLFDVGDHAVFDSFLALHPDAASVIATTRDTIHTFNVEGDEAFYNAINLAAAEGANYTETLQQIEIQRHAAVDPAPQYTDIFFNLIRNNVTFDTEIEAELVSLQNLTTYGAQVSTNKFLDGVIVLATATYTGEVTDEDFSEIETYLAEAIDGLQYFTQGLSAAAFLVLQDITAN